MAREGFIKGVMVDKNKSVAKPDKRITLAEYMSLMVKVENLERDTNIHLNTEAQELDKTISSTSDKPWFKNVLDIATSKGFLKGLLETFNMPDMPLSRTALADITARVYG